MKKIIILVCGAILLSITGCNINETLKQDDRGLYKILERAGETIYSDEEDPKYMSNGVIKSIKKDLPKTNCTNSCIYNNSDPIEILRDGGSKIYEYEVGTEKYYLIKCNKTDSKYHDGKDNIISKNKETLANYC